MGTLNLSFVNALIETVSKNKGVGGSSSLTSLVEIQVTKGGINEHTRKKGMCKSSNTEPFSTMEFNVLIGPYVGTPSFTCVYSSVVHIFHGPRLVRPLPDDVLDNAGLLLWGQEGIQYDGLVFADHGDAPGLVRD